MMSWTSPPEQNALPGPGHDDSPDAGLGIQRPKRTQQFLVDLEGQRVQPIGTIERDRRDSGGGVECVEERRRGIVTATPPSPRSRRPPVRRRAPTPRRSPSRDNAIRGVAATHREAADGCCGTSPCSSHTPSSARSAPARPPAARTTVSTRASARSNCSMNPPACPTAGRSPIWPATNSRRPVAGASIPCAKPRGLSSCGGFTTDERIAHDSIPFSASASTTASARIEPSVSMIARPSSAVASAGKPK